MNFPQIWFERKFEFSLPMETLPEMLARLRPAPGKLEAGHPLDLEPLWLARVADYVAAPAGRDPASVPGGKRKLLRTVDEIDVLLFARSIPHPRLRTPMRLPDHLYFVAEHDEHHLARIGELVTGLRQSNLTP